MSKIDEKYHKYLGKTFGNWTVLRYTGKIRSNLTYFWCRCKCGAEKNVVYLVLKEGKTKACRKCAQIVKSHDDVVAMVEQGFSYATIARAQGVSRERIRQIATSHIQYSIRTKRQQDFESLIPAIKRMYYDEGLCLQQIAKLISWPYQPLLWRLHKAGVVLKRKAGLCKVEGCDKEIYTGSLKRQLCRTHYFKQRYARQKGNLLIVN